MLSQELVTKLTETQLHPRVHVRQLRRSRHLAAKLIGKLLSEPERRRPVL
jgi:hypothetical protein